VRVLFVAWRDLAHPKAGGSEVLVDVLARGLQDRGHEVTLLCGGPIAPRPYPVVDNGSTYGQYLMAPIRYQRRFRDVDIVVDVVNGMPFFSPLWRRKPKVVLVTHVHTDQWADYFPKPIAAVFRTVEQRGLQIAYRRTRFVTISPSTADDLEKLGIDRARTQVMWLGAQLEEPSEPVARSSEPMFVALGRLAPNKRLDLLLDLWTRVSATTGGRLSIIGDGPEREHLAERIRTEPALSGVVLEGRVDEARKATLLREAWMLVHTADHEGWGLVIPEAGLCSTPSLAYDVPGVKDAVQNGVTGVLVNSDDAFVAEWIALAGDAERRASLGAQAAERAAAFTWDRSLDEFLVAADAAIDENRRSPARRSTSGLNATPGKASR
jgi:glycosyltransferase involved in cell wall biosynthesis